MPVRNEAAYIGRGLGAVLAQDYPKGHMEVIVIDGCSTDGTQQIVDQLAEQFPHLHVIENPWRIVPTALNLAIIRAQGEIIIRVDGHCEIPLDYVRRCVEHLQRDNVDGVGGSVETIGEGWMARSISVAMSTPFGVGGSAFRTLKGRTLLVDTIPFPAYTRSAMLRAGPYDEEMVRNQDDEYNYRLRKLGCRLLLAADVQSRYYSRSSLPSLWRQYYQYGYWKVRVLQKHPLQMRIRQFFPPAFVASLIMSATLAFLIPSAWPLFASVVGVYLFANLASSIWTAARRGWRYLPVLPVVFGTLHLAYGSGFLMGLVRFANRWGNQQGFVPIGPDAQPPIKSDETAG